MSRLGKLPVAIPSGVNVTLNDQQIEIKGKNGELKLPLVRDVAVTFTDGKVTVTPANDTKRAKAMLGTTRSIILSMVEGVHNGFTKKLEIIGVGYRVAVNGNILAVSLGFSHEVRFVIPAGITIKVEKPTSPAMIAISGADKQKVGQVAATLRALRKPEPYKGKGVRYEGEKVRKKEGKKK